MAQAPRQSGQDAALRGSAGPIRPSPGLACQPRPPARPWDPLGIGLVGAASPRL